jgi:hypothetical protein
MGYFSNADMAESYEAKWCNQCIHQCNYDCPVWYLHFLWNYDAVGTGGDKTKSEALEMFIPRDGAYNAKCKMFHEK